jgi:hypothetical protein
MVACIIELVMRLYGTAFASMTFARTGQNKIVSSWLEGLCRRCLLLHRYRKTETIYRSRSIPMCSAAVVPLQDIVICDQGIGLTGCT